ncbi:hypothetical protein [Bradyrhizobium sp.]|uniref:hypothetical protein n=1 Tax=Bradyrhizobium sp. TaxID=376 RepID=UPI001DA13683|nr:hypothetical protein [Bradyrhizobium sp.]MBI5323173.1 hypothetical protein [Bradyrhizobium sp.]
MTDHFSPAEPANALEIAQFLRRFASMMSNGQNSSYLNQAAGLLDDLTVRLAAALDEEKLWRYRHSTVTDHADELEAECHTLKLEIEELRTELGATIDRNAMESAETRLAFEQETDALRARIQAGEQLLADSRSLFVGERAEFESRLEACKVELAALGAQHRQEKEQLEAKIAALEASQADGRAASDQTSDARHRSPLETGPVAGERSYMQDNAKEEPGVVVRESTLRQVRAQFEHLARECILRGDVPSQVMCELGAHTIDVALDARPAEHLPVREMALDILT